MLFANIWHCIWRNMLQNIRGAELTSYLFTINKCRKIWNRIAYWDAEMSNFILLQKVNSRERGCSWKDYEEILEKISQHFKMFKMNVQRIAIRNIVLPRSCPVQNVNFLNTCLCKALRRNQVHQCLRNIIPTVHRGEKPTLINLNIPATAHVWRLETWNLFRDSFNESLKKFQVRNFRMFRSLQGKDYETFWKF